MVDEDGGGRFHIGINDINHEDYMVWSDGTPVDYEKWWGDEPNNSGDREDCTHMGWGEPLGWNDIPCQGWKEKFVCKNVGF